MHAESNGRRALDFLATTTNAIDLIISDVRMPQINGLDLLKAVRMGVPGISRHTTFALLTGYSDKDVVASAFSFDVDCFLIKPISARAIRERISQVMATDRPLKTPVDYHALADDRPAALAPWVEAGINLASEVGMGSEFDDSFAARGGTTAVDHDEPGDIGQSSSYNADDPNVSYEDGWSSDGRARVDGDGARDFVSEDGGRRMKVNLTDVREGAVLAEPIRMSDGQLVLDAGYKLDQRIVDRLIDLSALDKVLEQIVIEL